jgi:hypothetical protein
MTHKCAAEVYYFFSKYELSFETSSKSRNIFTRYRGYIAAVNPDQPRDNKTQFSPFDKIQNISKCEELLKINKDIS